MSLPVDAAFAPDLSALLAPLPGDDPTGESLRYAPAYAQIRDARFEEDQNLPMGEWTRPLKRADWRAMETLCIQALSTSTKDLQVAGWLTEAWTRRHGLAGLLAGTRLLEGLCRDFWQDIHPRADDGDNEVRTAPLFWANDTLSQTLFLHVALMPRADGSPPYLLLHDWQRTVATEFAAGGSRDSKAEGATSRQEMLQEALAHIPGLVRLDELAQQTQVAWDALTRLLDDKLGDESPSMSKVTETLKQMRMAVRSLLQHHDPRDALQGPANTQTTPLAAALEMPPMEDDAMPSFPTLSEGTETPATTPASSTPASPTAFTGKVTSRAEAYRLLELAAAYLEQTEPHSPTPYLIKRAITWGRLPLPELMQEVIQEEGDISRYFSLLGIKSH